MKYLKQEILDVTSNLTETTLAWDSSKAYAQNDEVLLGHSVFKCVTGNTNKSPADFENVYWVKMRVSNKYALVDTSSQTQSENLTGDIVVTFQQIGIETLAIGNYEASGILVEVLAQDGTTVLWTYENTDFYNEEVDDYYSYIYSNYDFKISKGLKIDIPVFGSYIRVTFASSGVRAACGYLVGGYAIDMGNTLFGVGFKYNSFATKTFDSFGTLSIQKRAVQDIVDFQTAVDSTTLPRIRSKIKLMYNDVAVFIVDDTTDLYENLLTLGVVQDVTTVLNNNKLTILSWSVLESV